MCHSGKCFLSIPVEMACFVLAIIKAVITGALLLISVVIAFVGAPFGVVGPMAIGSIVAFTFSVLLCNGINNHQAAQVKAYFIYGVVSVVLEVVATITLTFVVYYEGAQIGIVLLIFCAGHCLFLMLVHATYYKMFEANPSPLVLV